MSYSKHDTIQKQPLLPEVGCMSTVDTVIQICMLLDAYRSDRCMLVLNYMI